MVSHQYCESTLFNLSPLNTDPHHLAVAYRLQLGNADFDPRCVEVIEDDLRDVFGQGFQQRKMSITQHSLEVLRDFRIIQRVLDVVAEAGAMCSARVSSKEKCPSLNTVLRCCATSA